MTSVAPVGWLMPAESGVEVGGAAVGLPEPPEPCGDAEGAAAGEQATAKATMSADAAIRGTRADGAGRAEAERRSLVMAGRTMAPGDWFPARLVEPFAVRRGTVPHGPAREGQHGA